MGTLQLPVWLRLVKFSHSIFALPFALASAFVASAGMPGVRVLAPVLVCLVSARSAALGFNRLVDRDFDARNPRTQQRELPSGALTPLAVGIFTLLCSLLFVAGAFWLGPLCGWLSLPVLAVLLGYSYAKRVTWLAHFALGLALALAPLGAWVAVRGDLAGDLRPPVLLAAAVLAWVAGFDVIYACQDQNFDRQAGLHSIPARFGIGGALWVARALHLLTLVLLLGFGWSAGLGAWFWVSTALVAALLAFEHRLVTRHKLERIDLAFFTVNGWIGFCVFAGVALDLFLREPL